MKKNCKYSILLLSYFLLIAGSCLSQRVSFSKNIVYDPTHQLALNVFYPKKESAPKEVMVFIHGGNWNRGTKAIYSFHGKRLAKKDIVAVIIDYRLHPHSDYEGMARDAAKAVKWTAQNISTYGGDPNKIFVSGHSAGGQIAALISTDDRFFDELEMKNPIKGVVLIDAFGLDMHSYLVKGFKYNRDVYHEVFTSDPENWKKASATYHLHNGMPPFLILVGGITFKNIITDNYNFWASIKKYQPDTPLIKVKRTGHLGMIFKYTNPQKKAYREVAYFMKQEPVKIKSNKF